MTTTKATQKPASKPRKKKKAPSSDELSKIAVTALEDIKAQAIECIDVQELTAITDYMIIATGTSNTHVKALADEVSKQVKEAGGTVVGIEGKMHADWVLVDTGGAVIHIMMAAVRDLYKLEELWKFKPPTDSADDIEDASGS